MSCVHFTLTWPPPLSLSLHWLMLTFPFPSHCLSWWCDLSEMLAERFNLGWNKKASGKGKDLKDFVRPMTRLRVEANKVRTQEILLIEWMTIDYLTHFVVDWMSCCLVFVISNMTIWLIDWLTDWMTPVCCYANNRLKKSYPPIKSIPSKPNNSTTTRIWTRRSLEVNLKQLVRTCLHDWLCLLTKVCT